jgi:hypothetical protein
MPFLEDYGIGPEGGGRTKDGSDIVWVRYLIEDDRKSAAGWAVEQVFEYRRRKRFGFEGNPLMNRVLAYGPT